MHIPVEVQVAFKHWFLMIFFIEKFWHKDCFKCVECKRVIEGLEFASTAGKIYCTIACYYTLLMSLSGKDCHHEKFGIFKTNCFKCNKRISDGEVVEHGGHAFHKDCFKCAKCISSHCCFYYFGTSFLLSSRTLTHSNDFLQLCVKVSSDRYRQPGLSQWRVYTRKIWCPLL